jgi:hypothetical protein
MLVVKSSSILIDEGMEKGVMKFEARCVGWGAELSWSSD